MTYLKGNLIDVSDFNNLVGTPASGTNALSKFTSEATANGKLGAIWGVGYGKWGWGQTTPALSIVEKGHVFSASNWTNMYQILSNVSQKTGVSITNQTGITKGNEVKVLPNLASNISAVSSSRYNTTSTVDSSVLGSDTRTTTWNSTIDNVAQITFGSGDLARYFFNSGSSIIVRIRHNSTTSLQDTEWNSFLLNSVGDIIIGPESVSSTKTGATITNIGYWNSSTTYQTIYYRTSPGGYYAYSYAGAFRCTVQIARIGANNVSGSGDNGSSVGIRVLLEDNHTGASDLIQGSTVVQILARRNNAVFTPAAPSSVLFTNTFN